MVTVMSSDLMHFRKRKCSSPLERLTIFSRKVFCGATSPLFPPGIVRLCVSRCSRQVGTLCAWSLCRRNGEAHGNVALWLPGASACHPRALGSKLQVGGHGELPAHAQLRRRAQAGAGDLQHRAR